MLGAHQITIELDILRADIETVAASICFLQICADLTMPGQLLLSNFSTVHSLRAATTAIGQWLPVTSVGPQRHPRVEAADKLRPS